MKKQIKIHSVWRKIKDFEPESSSALGYLKDFKVFTIYGKTPTKPEYNVYDVMPLQGTYGTFELEDFEIWDNFEYDEKLSLKHMKECAKLKKRKM